MFIEFLHIQTTAQATHVKFKCTLNPENFSQKEFFTKQVHKRLKFSGIALDLKMTLNLNCMPLPEARVTYKFSRTSGTAHKYITLKIQARLY